MSKSTENVKKKYADTYKWTDDEVELLLTVTKEYKTKQIAKSIDWEFCVDKYGEILEAYSAHYPSPEDAAAIGKDFPHRKDELRSRPESPSVMARSFFWLYDAHCSLITISKHPVDL